MVTHVDLNPGSMDNEGQQDGWPEPYPEGSADISRARAAHVCLDKGVLVRVRPRVERCAFWELGYHGGLVSLKDEVELFARARSVVSGLAANYRGRDEHDKPGGDDASSLCRREDMVISQKLERPSLASWNPAGSAELRQRREGDRTLT